MHWNTLVVQIATFLGVSGITLLAFRAIWTMDRRIEDRLLGLSDSPTYPRRPLMAPAAREPSVPLRTRVGALASRLLPNDERERTQVQARLMHAGIYALWAPGIFSGLKFALVTVPPLVGLILGEAGLVTPTRGLYYGGIAGGMGIVLPSMWLSRRKAIRHAVLLRSLPDFLDLMVTCIQSGLSLDAAIQRVGDELAVAHPLLASELALLQRQVELGASPDLAMRSLAERTDLPALFTLTTLIEQARRFGTSVSEALRTHAEMLRDQREQRADELAQKASVKILFPTLLFIFPAIFVVLVGPAALDISEKFSAPPAMTLPADRSQGPADRSH
jgi:tight adherence protein C